MIGLGTLINVAAIVLGGIFGLLFGKSLGKRHQDTLMKTCGVTVIFIGIAGVLSKMLSVTGTALVTGRSLLLVKDSYANSFLPYLIGEYDRITVVDRRFYAEPVLWLLRDGGYTDALVLYNLKSFASDQYVRFIDLSD